MVSDQNNQQCLMTPGPVPAPESVLKKLAEPILHHRTPEFTKLYASIQTQLKQVFKTQAPVLPLTSSGSGAMEATIVNLFSPGDHVAVVVAGKFGQRWQQMAETYGLIVHSVSLKWGEALQPEHVQEIFAKHTNLKGFLVQACETSTATWHNIQECSKVLLEHPECLYIVDGITAVGVSELAMDDWNIDVLISGSQKAFMMPTGLSFIALSEKAWKAHKEAKIPRFYFDLGEELKAYHKQQTRFSSPASLLKALHKALQIMTSQPHKSVERAFKMSQVWQHTSTLLGLYIFSQNPSPSLTALLLPEAIDGQALRQTLEDKYGVILMGGQDQLRGKILRVGHMGDIKKKDIIYTLESLANALRDHNHSVSEDSLKKALTFAQQHLDED